ETGVEQALAVVLHGEGSQRDYGQGVGLRVPSEPFEGTDAVAVGQLDVHENEVGRVLESEFDPVGRRSRLEYLVTVVLEDVALELEIELVVLDDQDQLARHASSPFSIRASADEREKGGAVELGLLR